MPPVNENKERAASRIFSQLFGHQRIEAIETLAQIARNNRQENLQPAREA
jgi:hypothetical protein